MGKKPHAKLLLIDSSVIVLLFLNFSLENTKIKWFSFASPHMTFILTCVGRNRQRLNFIFGKMLWDSQ